MKKSGKKVKVKFIKSPTGNPFKLPYWIGDVKEVDADLAKRLLEAGMVDIVTAANSRQKATKENYQKRG